MNKWLLNSSKFIGTDHVKFKMPCQDDSFTMIKNDVAIAILSDGCGSEDLSEYGAKIVTSVISNYISDNFDELYYKTENEIKIELTNILLNKINLFIDKNKVFINNYFNSSKGKRHYEKAMDYTITSYLKHDDQEQLVQTILFDATALFVAIKDDRCIIGHCGDGYIVGHLNGNFKIVSSEPKLGERNETNYPSTVYYKTLASKNTNYWDLFRILKIENNKYDGFILMSDGAETSLINPSNKQQKEDSANINNCDILFQILSEESPTNAKYYLTEQLDKTYRYRFDEDGDQVEVTGDDVSVSIIVSTSIYDSEQGLDNYNYNVDNGINNKDFSDTILQVVDENKDIINKVENSQVIINTNKDEELVKSTISNVSNDERELIKNPIIPNTNISEVNTNIENNEVKNNIKDEEKLDENIQNVIEPQIIKIKPNINMFNDVKLDKEKEENLLNKEELNYIYTYTHRSPACDNSQFNFYVKVSNLIIKNFHNFNFDETDLYKFLENELNSEIYRFNEIKFLLENLGLIEYNKRKKYYKINKKHRG